ncbi:hypothetical protein LSAT2_018512 [Lamellibrachia satsuma]|nr:hypothetical protein LSAT2_018512 [Lamellibrachia satsuma]
MYGTPTVTSADIPRRSIERKVQHHSKHPNRGKHPSSTSIEALVVQPSRSSETSPLPDSERYAIDERSWAVGRHKTSFVDTDRGVRFFNITRGEDHAAKPGVDAVESQACNSRRIARGQSCCSLASTAAHLDRRNIRLARSRPSYKPVYATRTSLALCYDRTMYSVFISRQVLARRGVHPICAGRSITLPKTLVSDYSAD